MTRTEVAIHDIASALIGLKPEVPNRHAIYVKTLESLARFVISEHEVSKAKGIRDDLARVAAINAASRQR